MQLTNSAGPAYFHQVVDCQWACPAHTPVPEYIRLIGQGRYDDAYMINWKSNVFPGDPRADLRPSLRAGLPARDASRKTNGSAPEPVAICRLKRVAADHKGDVRARPDAARRAAQPQWPAHRPAWAAGPASLTVARDLAPLGYQLTLFDKDEAKVGGDDPFSQIPRFRLPEAVIDEEDRLHPRTPGREVGDAASGRIDSTASRACWNRATTPSSSAPAPPRGRDLQICPAGTEAAANIHIGIDWLSLGLLRAHHE